MYVRVHAVPGARKESVVKESDAVFTISVKEPAERNMANKRIIQILSDVFKVKVGDIRLLTGHRSSSKMYSVDRD